MRTLACYEEILKVKKMSVCHKKSVSLSHLRTCAQPPVLLDVGKDDPNEPLMVQDELADVSAGFL
jgi:hypothetical protein